MRILRPTPHAQCHSITQNKAHLKRFYTLVHLAIFHHVHHLHAFLVRNLLTPQKRHKDMSAIVAAMLSGAVTEAFRQVTEGDVDDFCDRPRREQMDCNLEG